MSQFIPEETIQEVLLRADITDIIGDYVLLKKYGAHYKGLCPFHTEKTPSFTVSPAKGLFYCFGCRASGNVLRFLMQHEGFTFPEAVRTLMARYGLQLPAAVSSAHQQALEPLYRLHKATTAFFQHCLVHDAAAQQARAYCRQRQLDGDLISRFALGYAPAAWETLVREMQRQGFAQELLLQSGLVVAREHQRGVYDRFRHRLIFPIHDRHGRPVAFGGRTLEGTEAVHVPKYLNSPETPIFQKSRTLYGFHLARQASRHQGCVIVVEGYTDVIACHRHGIVHVVGTLGTALTTHHVDMLKGLAKEVILVFDSDAAGGSATERGIGMFLDAGVRVRIATLPAGDDPDSFLRQHGGDAFLRHTAEAMTFVEYLLGRAGRLYDLHTPAGQADCVARLLPLLRKIDHEVERWGYLMLLAERLGIPPEVLRRELYSRSPSQRSHTPRQPPQQGEQAPGRPGPADEYTLLQIVCHDLHWLPRVQKQIGVDDFQNPELQAVYALLLQVAPQDEKTVFPSLLEQVAGSAYEQLITQMVLEPLPHEEEALAKALHDCLASMRRRRVVAELRQLKAQMSEIEQHGHQVDRRLLQAYHKLSKELHSG